MIKSTRSVAFVSVAACLSLLALLTGCGGSTSNEVQLPSITLEEARHFQNQTLTELIDAFPAEHRVDEWDGPIAEMSAMRCDWASPIGENRGSDGVARGVFLPGGYDAEFSFLFEVDSYLAQIEDGYEAIGWQIEHGTGDAKRTMTLTSADGYEFYLSVTTLEEGGFRISVSSFSPCIQEPEGFDIFEKY